jgi:hypothetical protein
VTSYLPKEASPQRLLELARAHWSIENGQNYRRDRTQDEDRCSVRDSTTARNLSLFRSLAIFLFKAFDWLLVDVTPLATAATLSLAVRIEQGEAAWG